MAETIRSRNAITRFLVPDFQILRVYASANDCRGKIAQQCSSDSYTLFKHESLKL